MREGKGCLLQLLMCDSSMHRCDGTMHHRPLEHAAHASTNQGQCTTKCVRRRQTGGARLRSCRWSATAPASCSRTSRAWPAPRCPAPRRSAQQTARCSEQPAPRHRFNLPERVRRQKTRHCKTTGCTLVTTRHAKKTVLPHSHEEEARSCAPRGSGKARKRSAAAHNTNMQPMTGRHAGRPMSAKSNGYALPLRGLPNMAAKSCSSAHEAAREGFHSAAGAHMPWHPGARARPSEEVRCFAHPSAVVSDRPKVARAQALAGELAHVKALGGPHPVHVLGACAHTLGRTLSPP